MPPSEVAMSLEEYEKQRKAEALEKQRAEAALQAKKERIVGLAKKLPSAKDETTQAQRARLFSSMDANANGLLQLQEVGAGLAKLLGTQEAASIEAIIEAAYNKARTAKVSRSERGADYVEKGEFRLFLIHVKRALLTHLLDAVEHAGDGQLDERQYTSLLNLIVQGWGIDAGGENASAGFRALDTLNATVIPMAKFRSFVMAKGVEADDVTESDSPPPSELELKLQSAIQTGKLADTTDLMSGTLELTQLMAHLPCTLLRRDFHARQQLFETFDTNHNGFLALSEVDMGLRVVLGAQGGAIDALSPAVTRAFHAAKGVKKSQASENGASAAADEAVSRSEFRLLLVYLKRYFELLQMFDAIDTSDDRRISMRELQQALPLLLGWGVAVPDAASEFKKMDIDGGGMILFDEFSGWALAKCLDKDAKDNLNGEEDLIKHHKSSAEVAAKGVSSTAARVKAMDERAAKGNLQENALDRTGSLSMDSLRGKLPASNRPEHVARRAEIFSTFDVNGNGTLALVEIDRGLRTTFGKEADAIAAFSPAIALAFHAAKDAKKGRPGGLDSDDAVSRSEFRLLLVALKRYFELLQMFDAIDTSDDRRIDLREFKQALPLLKTWGVAITDPQREFTKIDVNGGGALMFDEFSGWALGRGLDKDARDNVLGEDDLTTLHKMMGGVSGAGSTSPRKARGAAVREVRPNRRWQVQPDLPQMVLALPCEKTEADLLARGELFADFLDPDGFEYLYEDEVLDGLRSALGPIAQKRHAGAAASFVPLAVRRAFRTVIDQKGIENVGRQDFRLLLLYFKWHFFQLFGQPTPIKTVSPRRRSPDLSPRGTAASPDRTRDAKITAKLPMISPRYSPRK